MADVQTGSMKFPYPLGKILPGANFATLSAPVTMNVNPVSVDGSSDYLFNEILLMADEANTASIFICSNASAPDLVGFTNILAELRAGDAYPRGPHDWANRKDIRRFFVGALNATDFVFGSIDRF